MKVLADPCWSILLPSKKLLQFQQWHLFGWEVWRLTEVNLHHLMPSSVSVICFNVRYENTLFASGVLASYCAHRCSRGVETHGRRHGGPSARPESRWAPRGRFASTALRRSPPLLQEPTWTDWWARRFLVKHICSDRNLSSGIFRMFKYYKGFNNVCIIPSLIF